MFQPVTRANKKLLADISVLDSNKNFKHKVRAEHRSLLTSMFYCIYIENVLKSDEDYKNVAH